MKKLGSTLVIVVMIIFCTASITVAGDIQQQLTKESALEQIMERGVLRVNLSTFVPWTMMDKNGKPIGFEVDVATRLAEDMGVKIEFIPTQWDGIIPALLTGKFDIVIGGFGIIPKRNLKVNYSIPYDYSGMSIVANKKLAAGFTRLEDFNKKDVTIAARLGSTSVTAVKKYMPKAEIRMFKDESQVYQELLNGRAHGVVANAPTPAFYAIENPDKLFLPFEDTFTKEPIGFAVRKGDYDTINFLNSWITYVGSEGFLKERKHYWFNTREWESLIK